jgi:hypothetical protein
VQLSPTAPCGRPCMLFGRTRAMPLGSKHGSTHAFESIMERVITARGSDAYVAHVACSPHASLHAVLTKLSSGFSREFAGACLAVPTLPCHYSSAGRIREFRTWWSFTSPGIL